MCNVTDVVLLLKFGERHPRHLGVSLHIKNNDRCDTIILKMQENAIGRWGRQILICSFDFGFVGTSRKLI
jgi:hypothetical protein